MIVRVIDNQNNLLQLLYVDLKGQNIVIHSNMKYNVVWIFSILQIDWKVGPAVAC